MLSPMLQEGTVCEAEGFNEVGHGFLRFVFEPFSRKTNIGSDTMDMRTPDSGAQAENPQSVSPTLRAPVTSFEIKGFKHSGDASLRERWEDRISRASVTICSSRFGLHTLQKRISHT